MNTDPYAAVESQKAVSVSFLKEAITAFYLCTAPRGGECGDNWDKRRMAGN